MDKDSVKQKLSRIFQEVFDNDHLTLNDNTSPEDIEEWDSLAQVNLLVQIERAFHIKFSIDEVTALRSVGDFMYKIEEKTTGKYI